MTLQKCYLLFNPTQVFKFKLEKNIQNIETTNIEPPHQDIKAIHQWDFKMLKISNSEKTSH